MTAYRTSIVGLIDILGVSDSLSNPASAQRYSEAVAAILNPMIGDKDEWCFVLPHVDEERPIEILLSPAFSRGSKISFISDSIVVSAPVDASDEPDEKCRAILACLEAMKGLQRSLLMLGLRSRGGVSIGGLIHSGELLVGEGLLRAYEIERREAIYPRTVIDPALIHYLVETVNEHFPVYGNRVAHAIRRDEDGAYFVDYLGFCPKDGYCGLEAEFAPILTRLRADLEVINDRPWGPKLEWLTRYASASFDECRGGVVEPFGHADRVFAVAFPRTNETLREYMESESELARTLGTETLRPGSVALRFPLWPLGWRSILTAQQKERLEAELTREVASGHVLEGEATQVLGRFNYSDDTLFLLEGGRVAQVHLTWNPEDRPEWPWTIVYGSFQSWADEWRKKAGAIGA